MRQRKTITVLPSNAYLGRGLETCYLLACLALLHQQEWQKAMEQFLKAFPSIIRSASQPNKYPK